jgi:hypothetical protein
MGNSKDIEEIRILRSLVNLAESAVTHTDGRGEALPDMLSAVEVRICKYRKWLKANGRESL